ncbi:TIGR04222 domain-containing membrane protein [Phytohabitans flavus]|uniref:TIGR04222 domain-containing membrane protein n=1 Tax=Phytohabitans flavus TaxID=1076124 RepID=UPI00362B97D7
METVLAAAGDTWGIPGSTFAASFAGAAAVLLIAALIHRIVLFSGRHTPVDRLGPQQAAYLNGGDKLAVYSSLAGLRATNAIAALPGRTLVASGPMPPNVTPLDQAVYHAASQHVRARDVVNDQWVRTALAELRDDLERRGLARDRHTRKAARAVPFLMLALAGLGGVRMIAGAANGKPVGILAALVIVMAFLALFFIGSIRPVTRAGGRTLGEMRRQHAYLSPR